VAIVEIGGTVATSNRCVYRSDPADRQELGRITLCLCMSRWCRLCSRAGVKDQANAALRQELLSVGFSRTFCCAGRTAFCRRHQVEDCAVLQRRGGSGDTAKDVASIYEVPIVFAHEEVDTLVLRRLKTGSERPRSFEVGRNLVHRVYNPKDVVRIASSESTWI